MNTRPPVGPYEKLSAEELRTIRECNNEAFYRRSIPTAALFSVATHYAVKAGYLKPNPRFSSMPKVAFAAFCGYLIGKVSYMSVCRERILQLPDSKLAQLIRQQNKQQCPVPQPPSDVASFNAAEVFTNVPQKPIFDDHKPDERDRVEALDDYEKLTDSLSEYSLPSVEGSSATPTLTYDERRRLNREEYHAKLIESRKNFGRQAASATHTPPPQLSVDTGVGEAEVPHSPPQSAPPRLGGRRNKYGDIIYDE